MTRLLRLAAAATALGLLLTARAASSQVASPSLAPTLWRDVPVAEALERLAAAGPMNIVWDAATLRSARAASITCRVPRDRPEELLACITREAGLDYVRMSSGTYVVIARAESATALGAMMGDVVDAASGGPLASAHIWLAEAKAARLADGDGRFAFDALLPGTYELAVQAVGYRSSRTRVTLVPGERRRLRLSLEPITPLAAPIVVSGIRPGDASYGLGATTLTESAAIALVSAPGLFMPGSASPLGVTRRDGLGDLHLQGGDVGEHPWRLDGIPLFDANGLSAILGTVAPLAIERVTVRRAGFRAADGSFAAGVIDLAHAVGDEQTLGNTSPNVTVTADPMATTARLGIPLSLSGARGNAMLALREGTWEWTAPRALATALQEWSAPDAVLLQRVSGFGALPGMQNLDSASFTSIARLPDDVQLRDLHAAARLTWDDLRQVNVSAFSTTRGLDLNDVSSDGTGRALTTHDGYQWHTLGAQAGYRSFVGARIEQRAQLWFSTHDLRHRAAMEMNGALPSSMSGAEGNRVDEIGLRSDWTLWGAGGKTLRGGAELAQTRASVDLANAVLRPLTASARVTRATFYGDLVYPLRNTLVVESGLRVTQLQSGDAFLEPRIALRQDGGGPRPWAWRIGMGGYRQFVNQFDVATTVPNAFVPSIRFWLPSETREGVATAWHLAAEGSWRPAATWEIRAEAYARWQPTIPTLDYGALYASGAGAPQVVSMMDFVKTGRGTAAGAGLRAIHDGQLASRSLRLELAIDAGTARRTYPSRFGGAAQLVPWLEPWRAQFAADFELLTGLMLGSRFRSVWGRPWALRQAYYDLFAAAPDGAGLPVNAPGAMRRPAIIDLDVGVEYRRVIADVPVSIGASVTNVLDRANVLDYGLRRASATGAATTTYEMVPRYLPRLMPAFTLRIGH